MADLNVTYNGYVEELQTRWTIQVCKGVMTPFGCIGSNEDKDVSDTDLFKDWKAANQTFNQATKTTVAEVKVPYLAGADRVDWLKDRLDAINKRVSLIQERLQPFREILVQNGQLDADQTLGLAITSIGAAFVPILAPIVSVLKAQISGDNAERLSSAQAATAKYSADLQELAAIKTQILSEYVKAGNSTDPTSEAPTISTWYYFVGIGLLLLFFVWLRRRNQKRRKR